jgi:hypothetical protein
MDNNLQSTGVVVSVNTVAWAAQEVSGFLEYPNYES